MSHFVTIVIGENPEYQLKDFDENIEVDEYIELTKEEVITNKLKEILDYKENVYDKFLEDKKSYIEKCTHDRHISYLENEFPKILKIAENNDKDGLYRLACKYRSEDSIDENGNFITTYNPKSKWDWYLLGGRWSGMIKLKDGATGEVGSPGVFENKTGIDSALKKDIANLDELSCFALLIKGEWFEKGEMGWFGIAKNEMTDDKWNEFVKTKLNEADDDDLISIYDLHI